MSEQERCAFFARREDESLAYCDRLEKWYFRSIHSRERRLFAYRASALIFPALTAALSLFAAVRQSVPWVITAAAFIAVLAVGALVRTRDGVESRLFKAKLAQIHAEKLLYMQRMEKYSARLDSDKLLEIFLSRIIEIHSGCNTPSMDGTDSPID